VEFMINTSKILDSGIVKKTVDRNQEL